MSRRREPRIAVRRGVTRTVLLAGPYAVKVPSLRSHDAGLPGVLWSLVRGISANLSEREWSGTDPGFCPVRWSAAGLVNVYPRCRQVDDDGAPIDYDAVADFAGPMDRKPQNLGWLDGRLVWVDYDMNWNDRPPCQHVGAR